MVACNSAFSLDQHPPDLYQVVLLEAAERAEEPVVGAGVLLMEDLGQEVVFWLRAAFT